MGKGKHKISKLLLILQISISREEKWQMKEVLIHQVSQRSNVPKQSSQPMTQQQKKSSTNNSDDGGDQNPMRGNLEKSHKLQDKRKRQGT